MTQEKVMQALVWYEIVGKKTGSVTIPYDELQAIINYIRDQDILINTWCERFEDTQEKWEKAYDELEGKYEKLLNSTDDFPLCSISGCEGASSDCHKTCPDSVPNKARAEAIDSVIERLEDEVDAHNQYIEDRGEFWGGEVAYTNGLKAALDIVRNMKGETK